MDPLIQELIRQGGLGLLAAVAIWVGYKVGNLRAQDLKLALDRETESRKSTEELHRATLATLTSFTSELSGLKTSVIGLLEDARTGRLDDTWARRRKQPSGSQ